MSFPTRRTCPHGRGVFAYLADGPWKGDQSDPNWGRYPWAHDTTREGDHGHLEVCDLMQFALPVDVGEMCACGHSADMHKAGDGPIPAGMLAKPRHCHCDCPDFRHRREDLERWRAESGSQQRADERPVVAAKAASASPARSGPAEQLELFAVDPVLARPTHSLGPRGFPMCSACKTRESIGPRHIDRLDLCVSCWTPELDPIGAAAWDRVRAEGRQVETVLISGGVL